MSPFLLRKMKAVYAEPVAYHLLTADGEIPLNPLLGQKVKLTFTGRILCLQCGRKTSKSYQQGYCFPCSQSLAQTDMCSVRPERCHFHKGTCRDAEWGQAHCMIPHTIYLANSSGLKIGITRAYQRTTRWIDQGAIEAIPIATVEKRLDAGVIETMLKEYYPDQTNWRVMLKGAIPPLDLVAARDEALGYLPSTVQFKEAEDEPLAISYPVLTYPSQVRSLNLDKQAEIEGTLQGIKGQYWILDQGVINLRSFSGYEVTFES